MHAKQHLHYAILLSLTVLILSFVVSFIPCKVASNDPDIPSVWAFCHLNPDYQDGSGVTKKFFGYTSSLTKSYLVTFTTVFVLTLLLLHLLLRKPRREK